MIWTLLEKIAGTNWLILDILRDLKRAVAKKDLVSIGTETFFLSIFLPFHLLAVCFGLLVFVCLTVVQLPGMLLRKKGNSNARKTGSTSVNDDPSSW